MKNFKKQYNELVNDYRSNENFIKYKGFICQTAEPELIELMLKETELIIKDFKSLEKDEINLELFKLAEKDLVTEICFLVKNV